MTIGDGIACLAMALAVVSLAWAAAWSAVRSAAIRDEALRRLGEPKWQPKAKP